MQLSKNIKVFLIAFVDNHNLLVNKYAIIVAIQKSNDKISLLLEYSSKYETIVMRLWIDSRDDVLLVSLKKLLDIWAVQY
jgi:hypothetical protein